MQIDEAIALVRERARIYRQSERSARRYDVPIAERFAYNADALETVCNEVETLRETCRGYAEALTRQDSGQIQPESDESGDVGEMLGWK